MEQAHTHGGAAAAAAARAALARHAALAAALAASTTALADDDTGAAAAHAESATMMLRLAIGASGDIETGDEDEDGDGDGDGDDREECPICLDARAEVVLPCSHGFCRDCARSWGGLSSACPCCRAQTMARSGRAEQWELLESGREMQGGAEYAAVALGFLDGLGAAADGCVRAMPPRTAALAEGERPFLLVRSPQPQPQPQSQSDGGRAEGAAVGRQAGAGVGAPGVGGSGR